MDDTDRKVAWVVFAASAVSGWAANDNLRNNADNIVAYATCLADKLLEKYEKRFPKEAGTK